MRKPHDSSRLPRGSAIAEPAPTGGQVFAISKVADRDHPLQGGTERLAFRIAINIDYRRAGADLLSVPVGMVVTRALALAP